MLHEKIRALTIERKFIPVFMGSAYKNKGVQLALNGVLKYLPSPKDKENRGFEIRKNAENKKIEK